MTYPRIAVTCTSDDKRLFAEKLACELKLPYIHDVTYALQHYDYLLSLTPHYLGLINKSIKHPFYIDFLSGKLRYRSREASLRKEALAKAISISPHQHPLVVDLTAGLGRDSYILATLGYNVIMLERSAILCALLQDALKRAEKEVQLAPICERLHLIHTNSLIWLTNTYRLSDIKKPHVIYLDPMFPERKKSASVKKEMVILKDLLETSKDEEKLFELALTCATHRVVVKRPRLAANIAIHPKPSYSIIGKSSRFDIYLATR
jgi:16S rRNA (guanine1516-N2)-methyltransferase